MGKPTGFLEFDRCENEAEDPAARTAGFGEFHHRTVAGKTAGAGRTVHELRRAVLPVGGLLKRHGVGLPAAQSDPRME